MSGGSLRFAANMGLSRLDCKTCGEERLHHKGHCVSCKTGHPSRRYKPLTWNANPGSLNRKTRKLRGQALVATDSNGR